MIRKLYLIFSSLKILAILYKIIRNIFIIFVFKPINFLCKIVYNVAIKPFKMARYVFTPLIDFQNFIFHYATGLKIVKSNLFLTIFNPVNQIMYISVYYITYSDAFTFGFLIYYIFIHYKKYDMLEIYYDYYDDSSKDYYYRRYNG